MSSPISSPPAGRTWARGGSGTGSCIIGSSRAAAGSPVEALRRKAPVTVLNRLGRDSPAGAEGTGAAAWRGSAANRPVPEALTCCGAATWLGWADG